MYTAQIAHHPLAILMALAIGLVAGSFVNCWAYRRVHGGSVLHGRSCCPACGHVLAAGELVPLFSWLVQCGRCRHCKAPISVRYPAAEAVCAIALLGVLWRLGSPPSDALWLLETVELALFACILLYASLTDLDDFLIPNGAIVAALAVRAAYLLGCFVLGAPDAFSQALSSLVGGLVLGGGLLVLVLVADRVLGRDSMGGGDLKLMFAAGCYFGWQLGLFCLLVACLVGIVGALALQHAGAKGSAPKAQRLQDGVAGHQGPGLAQDEFMRKTIPFGPAIAIACWITMVWGSGVLEAYLALFQ